MSKKTTASDLSSSDVNDETSSIDSPRRKSSKRSGKKTSIKNYVTNLLTKQETDDEQQPIDLTRTQIKVETKPKSFRDYENISAFRQYKTQQNSSSDEETKQNIPTEHLSEMEDSLAELNFDPNPVREARESQEQVYTQKVYLRQLQPPTPQPVEIQVKEVLIKPQTEKPPIHVHVGQREPRTPSPIVIKTAPPPPPPQTNANEPIVYNKYLPPPKQQPQQIIIHRYPDLPPKPRPIVVEQWLPYKPAPRRIIKHSLPPEQTQTPPAPHNLIISYSKPRAVIEVELVRLPVIKVDPQAYEQMSAAGRQQLAQNPTFQHEQQYLSRNQSNNETTQLDWRI